MSPSPFTLHVIIWSIGSINYWLFVICEQMKQTSCDCKVWFEGFGLTVLIIQDRCGMKSWCENISLLCVCRGAALRLDWINGSGFSLTDSLCEESFSSEQRSCGLDRRSQMLRVLQRENSPPAVVWDSSWFTPSHTASSDRCSSSACQSGVRLQRIPPTPPVPETLQTTRPAHRKWNQKPFSPRANKTSQVPLESQLPSIVVESNYSTFTQVRWGT